MRFFDNSTINRTYVHAALQTFAENVGGVFVFVSLLKAEITVPVVFTALAAIFFLRIALRQSVVPVVKRIGLRRGLGCLAAALLTWQGFGYFWPLLLGLAGVVAGYQLLQNEPLQ